MQRKSLRETSCPVARTLDVIGEWWTLLILRDAFLGMRRFTEFQQSLGLARNVLSARLRKLVAEGLLETVPASDGSAYHEYVLTEKGKSLITVMAALRQWGERHLFAPGELENRMVDSASRQPVQSLTLQAEDGRALTPDEVLVVSDAATAFKSRIAAYAFGASAAIQTHLVH